MDPLDITLRFDDRLAELLRPALRKAGALDHRLGRRAAVKDVIESFGVPHTEVGAIRANGEPVSFGYIPGDKDVIEVMPLTPPVDVTVPTMLRPQPLPASRFIVDANVGKLAVLLRMAGIDAAYPKNLPDRNLALAAHRQQRILLSKDRALLQYKLIEHGHLVREIKPGKQLAEVVSFYGLGQGLAPFSRCLLCNALLEPVDKEDILHRLEPLTRKYYHHFMICRACDKIYWPGSHKDKMLRYLDAMHGPGSDSPRRHPKS